MMKKRTSSKKNKPKRVKPQHQFASVNVQQLLKDADTAMETNDLDQALAMYTTVYAVLDKQEKKDVLLLAQVLSKLGDVKASLGDAEGARDCFHKGISILNNAADVDPLQRHETRANLHLYLGQLCVGTDALQAYQEGIKDIKECLQLMPSENKDALDEMRNKISCAYTSVAELYLTDLCDEDNAEQGCEQAIQQALLMSENSADALQAMASLGLSQNRGEDATKCILQVYQTMQCGCQALAALVGFCQDDTGKAAAVELVDVDAANSLPSFEFRCQTAKLLLECNALQDDPSLAKQCNDAALQVLGSLLAENDEIVEVWCLTGSCFAAASDLDAAVPYFERGLQILLQVKQELEMSEQDCQEELQDVDEQIQHVQQQLKDVCGQEAVETEQDIEMEVA